jgi:OmpA-OmpF porin, OOP family
MRKLLLSTLLFMVLSLAVSAQNQTYKNAIQAKLNLIDYGMIAGNDAQIGEGFELAYFRNVAPFLNVGVPFKLGLVKLPDVKGNSAVANFDLLFRLENMAAKSKIIPYAFGGAGYTFEKDNNHAQLPFGAGLHFRISPYAFVNLQGEYRKALVDNRDNLQIGLGYVYLLHAVDRPIVPPTSNMNDRDRDGVEDSLDNCPDQPGPAAALGCPDRDNDGLGDAEDGCPDDAGTLETSGCPDFDKDGVADKDDDCPTEAGTWKGCPDADFDGVADKMDKCPNEAGTAANNGCPAAKDSDGDGFEDDKDECPTLAGPNMGCPDSDGDGVADNHDKCPTEKGTVANEGCPEVKELDSDGDAIPDRLDKCPNAAGPAANDGCPIAKDTDGDGVADDLDKCPATPGLVANNGCPEVKQEVKEKLAVVTKAVQFETAKSVLKAESYPVLDEVVVILRSYPEYALAISGHTDNVGNDERNLRLSQERAKACFDYLVFRGIKPERLRHAGFGKARPIADNSTSEGREINRRVEFEVIFE